MWGNSVCFICLVLSNDFNKKAVIFANVTGSSIFYYPNNSITFRFMKEGYDMEIVSAEKVPSVTDYMYAKVILENIVVVVNIVINQ